MPGCMGRPLIPVITLLLGGCGSSGFVMPDALEPQVDPSVSFQQLLASPDSYQGKMVVVGGEVLKASTADGGTVLEILQLPLEEGQRPARERTPTTVQPLPAKRPRTGRSARAVGRRNSSVHAPSASTAAR